MKVIPYYSHLLQGMFIVRAPLSVVYRRLPLKIEVHSVSLNIKHILKQKRESYMNIAE